MKSLYFLFLASLAIAHSARAADTPSAQVFCHVGFVFDGWNADQDFYGEVGGDKGIVAIDKNFTMAEISANLHVAFLPGTQGDGKSHQLSAYLMFKDLGNLVFGNDTNDINGNRRHTSINVMGLSLKGSALRGINLDCNVPQD
jgi:hypothetical protein